MECPHCGHCYLDGLGDFYQISNEIKMVRESQYLGPIKTEQRNLFGCPNCRKLFMGRKND